MDDDWDRILETFKPPWKIKRPTGGGYRIEDKNKRVLLYVYPSHTSDFFKPSEEEALTIVKAIAKMSKRKR